MKSWSKLWGPVVGFEALVVALGIASYRWLSAEPLMKTIWPWVLARGAGLAAYGLLTTMVMLGEIMSHPGWRRSFSKRLFGWHRMLALAVFVLVAIHGIALVMDRYAGVNWVALFVPGLSHYRPWAVGIGVLGAEVMVLMAVTAHLAQNVGRIKWMTLHRWALVTWILVLAHSLWSGTDTKSLFSLYEGSLALVALTAVLRYGIIVRKASVAEDTAAPVGKHDIRRARGG